MLGKNKFIFFNTEIAKKLCDLKALQSLIIQERRSLRAVIQPFLPFLSYARPINPTRCRARPSLEISRMSTCGCGAGYFFACIRSLSLLFK